MIMEISLQDGQKKNTVGTLMPKQSIIRVVGCTGKGNLNITIRSLSAKLYEYFPFMVEFRVNGKLESVIEFMNENEYHDVKLPVSSGDTIQEIKISSELGGIPRKRGMNEDVRELSTELVQIAFENGHQPVTRSGFKSKRDYDVTGSIPGEGATRHPVFVIGAYRSMTSITTWLLGQHPNISPIEETNWLSMLYLGAVAAFEQSLKERDGASDIYNITKADFLRWQGRAIDRLHHELADRRVQMVQTARLAGMADRYDARFALRRSPFAPKLRWVDGTPENTGIAIGLAEMFEGAQFVFMLRDPMPVISSLMHHGNAGGLDRSAGEAVDIWERMTQWGYEALEVLGPDRVILQSSEALIDDHARSISQLFAFLDEPQYNQAETVMSSKINSSRKDYDSTNVFLPPSETERLMTIRNGILAGRPLSSLPWRTPLWPFVERRFSMVNTLRSAMS